MIGLLPAAAAQADPDPQATLLGMPTTVAIFPEVGNATIDVVLNWTCPLFEKTQAAPGRVTATFGTSINPFAVQTITATWEHAEVSLPTRLPGTCGESPPDYSVRTKLFLTNEVGSPAFSRKTFQIFGALAYEYPRSSARYGSFSANITYVPEFMPDVYAGSDYITVRRPGVTGPFEFELLNSSNGVANLTLERRSPDDEPGIVLTGGISANISGFGGRALIPYQLDIREDRFHHDQIVRLPISIRVHSAEQPSAANVSREGWIVMVFSSQSTTPAESIVAASLVLVAVALFRLPGRN
jgi:hypothetical protein